MRMDSLRFGYKSFFESKEQFVSVMRGKKMGWSEWYAIEVTLATKERGKMPDDGRPYTQFGRADLRRDYSHGRHSGVLGGRKVDEKARQEATFLSRPAILQDFCS